MTLFEHSLDQRLTKQAPLATRMRPVSFEEFVGQQHIVGPKTVLRKAITDDHIPSIVLWGPPGTGKTTLANLIATATKSYFSRISAVSSGVSELRRITNEARDRLGMQGQRTIVFIDEIHRFNKAQQDTILPHIENGTIILIGATTENPSFEVISPLLSRSHVFTLKPLCSEEVESVVRAAIGDRERGLADLRPLLDEDAIKTLINLANGDARVALNTLELAVSATQPGNDGIRHTTVRTIEDAMQKRALLYDKAGDHHYDTISAFIKTVRGSDPNAAIYWLARMIEAGEDPLFIARRLVILAAEDVGMADPQALSVAVAAQQAVHFVGMPEGRIPLAEVTVYLASAPKSNSVYKAIDGALRDVKQTLNAPVPMHLRNATTDLMHEMGYGEGYKYSHDFDSHFARMQNLPDSIKDRRYYNPSDQGYEKSAAERLRNWWNSGKTPCESDISNELP